jgi:hypothetical protein
MTFDEYLQNLPLFHSWDGGKTWCPGGFERRHLAPLFKFLYQQLPANPTILETGAGNSTVTMLFLNPRRLISIAPDQQLLDRIKKFCIEHSISVTNWHQYADGSQWVLPLMASENRNSLPYLDFALIDGSHGWPTAFVDLEYTNVLLKKGGYILIDDIQLHSCKEIARLLDSLPSFKVALNLGKALVFEKIQDSNYLGEWDQQPYIYHKTRKYLALMNPNSLKESSLFRVAVGRVFQVRNCALQGLRKLARAIGSHRTGTK